MDVKKIESNKLLDNKSKRKMNIFFTFIIVFTIIWLILAFGGGELETQKPVEIVFTFVPVVICSFIAAGLYIFSNSRIYQIYADENTVVIRRHNGNISRYEYKTIYIKETTNTYEIIIDGKVIKTYKYEPFSLNYKQSELRSMLNYMVDKGYAKWKKDNWM